MILETRELVSFVQDEFPVGWLILNVGLNVAVKCLALLLYTQQLPCHTLRPEHDCPEFFVVVSLGKRQLHSLNLERVHQNKT